MKYSIFLTSVLMLLSIHASATDGGLLLRYDRIDKNHGKVSGAATAFGIDLSEFGVLGKKWILTATHNVVTDGIKHDNVVVKIDGKWVKCSIVIYDKDTDIALLMSEQEVGKRLRFANKDPLPKEPVRMSASIEGRDVEIYEGTLVSYFYQGLSNSLVRIKFGHGASGGPLVNQHGELVGVALAGVPDDNGSIRKDVGLFFLVSSIRTLIRSHLYMYENDKGEISTRLLS